MTKYLKLLLTYLKLYCFRAKPQNFINFIIGSLKYVIIILPLTIQADNKKLPIPRFASIKSNEVNARTGPSIRSPIDWIFIKKGEPVEIIAEYEQWRQIRDIKGEGGWVHLSVLSGKRSVIVTGNDMVDLIKNPADYRKIIAKVSPNVRCQLNKCKNNWCNVTCKDYKGWLLQKSLWGVYKDEQL